jgi:hypothetical protein
MGFVTVAIYSLAASLSIIVSFFRVILKRFLEEFLPQRGIFSPIEVSSLTPLFPRLLFSFRPFQANAAE